MTLNTKFMAETFFAALAGVPVTLELTAVALLISFPLGFWMALKKESGGKLSRRLIQFYVSFVRGTPIVLQILFIYSLLPSLLNHIIKNILGLSFNVFKINPILYAFLVFSLNTTAVLSEAFRSALLTVNHGQMEAALSVGLTRTQSYLRIIIPQALVAALPNICNATISLLKSTSLAYMMTVKDITAIAKLNAANGYNYIEAYIVIFVIYILLCTVVQLLFQAVERFLSAYKQRITPVRKDGKVRVASQECA
jgi:L-cystine transport system permease protein